jgi:hypothetical protein
VSPVSDVELYAAIRRDARAGMAKRALQRKYRVGFRTVVAALESAWPEPRRKPPPRGSRLDEFKPIIDEWLRDDLSAPRKQRHTAKRIFDRLLDEQDAAEAGISYQMVQTYVGARRDEPRLDAGHGVAGAFIVQSHQPGAEAEVDFGDVTINLAGEQVICYLFSFRLSYSGRPCTASSPRVVWRRSWKAICTRSAC